MYKKRQIKSIYCAVQGVPKILRLLLLTRFSLYKTKKILTFHGIGLGWLAFCLISVAKLVKTKKKEKQ